MAVSANTTPEGYIHVTGLISRTGIQEYSVGEMRRQGVPMRDDIPDAAIVRIYRDADEVFNDSSLRSFEYKPLTVSHPPHSVDAKSVKTHFAGITKAPVSVVGEHVSVGLVLMSHDAVASYRAGVKELSCGYSCGLDMTPGRSPDGQVYDGRQIDIEGNHVALVPAGRAGTAKILDKEKNQMADNKDNAGAIELGKLQAKLEALEIKATADAKEAQSKIDELQGTLDVATQAAKDATLTDAALDELVQKRVDLIERARKFAPKIVVDKKTAREIMVEAVKAQSTLDLADKSDEYVKAVFDTLAEPKTQTQKTETGDASHSNVVDFKGLIALQNTGGR